MMRWCGPAGMQRWREKERERERERVLASNQVSFSVSSALMKTDWGMIATSVIHE